MRLVPPRRLHCSRQLDTLTSLAMSAPPTGTRLVAHSICKDEIANSLLADRICPNFGTKRIYGCSRQLDTLTSLAMAAPPTGTRLVAHSICKDGIANRLLADRIYPNFGTKRKFWCLVHIPYFIRLVCSIFLISYAQADRQP
ncbi:hypothetical protein AVEN_177045-1 [Araneus ventricosus]|uniref:Uncharacterized protein n=1 Tax=Araneus ventricosus TaxID=182803 RepID=A0A4Y2CRI8_ARAVE|nr:hypothetical protein AVEN_177045-1 [Araneus ventricosus]